VVTGSSSIITANGLATPVTASCPSTAVLIGGGYKTDAAGNNVTSGGTYPSTSGFGGTWTAILFKNGGADLTVNAYAICLTP
jgi:hypothetical protein